MATNHNINVILNGTNGQNRPKTSAVGNVQRIQNKTTPKNPASKLLNSIGNKVGGVPSMRGISKMGVAGAVAFALVSSANKVADMAMDVYSASSGEKLLVGNIKKVKSYVLNPIAYAKDSIWTFGVLQSRINKRENYENNYQRELTGKFIVGSQYGKKS
jgi:hypothetical protein